MIYFKLPDDPALLAAVAKVAVRHGQLDYVLRMAVKSIERLTIRQGLDATERQGSAALRERVRKLARKKLGEGRALVLLDAMLAERGEQLNDVTSFSTGCGLPSWTAKGCCATTTTLGTHSQMSPSWTP
jgi:hypothetical protein